MNCTNSQCRKFKYCEKFGNQCTAFEKEIIMTLKEELQVHLDKLLAENKQLREWIREKLENSCDGCTLFNFHGRGQSYVCDHPEHGCWLEGGADGVGCGDHTEIKEILGE